MNQVAQTGETLVVGGTGKTGRRVMERLERAGVTARSASRRSEPPFSWDDSTTWPDVLRGVDRLYAVYPGMGTEEEQEPVGEFIQAAAAAGVRRFVLLNIWPSDSAVGSALRESGMEWTTVTPSWFNQNFSDDYVQKFREEIRTGVMATSYGDSAFAFIDADDIADVVVAALREDGHAGEEYYLNGPRALTFAQATEEIGKALGRRIEYTELTVPQYAERMVTLGLDKELAAAMAETADIVEEPSGDVERALGRAPKDFTEYAREAAATGVWG
ncbi:NmrA family NAD(P)-binding protein [Sciscionella sediminilitoris]|uniref:NmrA family NAD(P)-binding protein n=1 Tax=Sciscionella sediminilitoris TaxID=1445613 RepID=UPI0004DFBA9D|nr:NmrA family NAD(P)-binding protein [Sciscionella sp. SE31]